MQVSQWLGIVRSPYPRRTEAELAACISQWLGVLQAVVMVPVMLRLLRRRNKMPWPCLLHSQLYLTVQALDLAAVVSLAAGADDRALRLSAEVCVYLTGRQVDRCASTWRRSTCASTWQVDR